MSDPWGCSLNPPPNPYPSRRSALYQRSARVKRAFRHLGGTGTESAHPGKSVTSLTSRRSSVIAPVCRVLCAVRCVLCAVCRGLCAVCCVLRAVCCVRRVVYRRACAVCCALLCAVRRVHILRMARKRRARQENEPKCGRV